MNKRFLKVDYKDLSNQLKKRGVKGVAPLSMHYLRNVREGVLSSKSLLREIERCKCKYIIDWSKLANEVNELYLHNQTPNRLKSVFNGSITSKKVLELITNLLKDEK